MRAVLQKLAFAAVVLLAGSYAYFSLTGPDGWRALQEKRREIRALEEHNAGLARQVQEKRDRIRRLRESKAELELEIRHKLNLQRKDETTFKLQGQPETAP